RHSPRGLTRRPRASMQAVVGGGRPRSLTGTREEKPRRILLPLPLLLLPVGAFLEPATPAGRVLVTVGGDLPAGNVEASDEEDGDFFGYLDLTFATGVGFDDAALGALDQGSITLPAFGPWTDVTFTGPTLASVLIAAGAEGHTAQPMALDGYQVDIGWDNISSLNPILATHVDGRPLSLGGYGPAAIIYPPQENAETQEELNGLQVWAVIFIGVE
ncbi:MAG: hypothetical protein AB3N23_17020, partial [Paracoccaceae bacterium]